MKTDKLSSSHFYTEEAKLLSDVIEHLACRSREGIITLRINDISHRGYSDLFIVVRGYIVFAELKDNKGKESANQKVFREDMLKAGAIAGVCTNIYQVMQLIALAERRETDARK